MVLKGPNELGQWIMGKGLEMSDLFGTTYKFPDEFCKDLWGNYTQFHYFGT